MGAALLTLSHLDLAWLPPRHGAPEVDFILTIGAKRIPLEVKYQRSVDPHADTEALRTFIETAANNATFGILVVQTDEVKLDDPRIVALPLSTLMLTR